jgi:hypothetical protein
MSICVLREKRNEELDSMSVESMLVVPDKKSYADYEPQQKFRKIEMSG